ncbi:putative cytokinetic ring protein SteA [Saccharopolyspora sp. CA-218241]|uniref:putative cytokinetic ring protein SteA n=1 Tax=Saccharopolyspora sp. CA-218241 TaxID=3240027 RepID=UPI003D99E1B5
MKLSGLLPRLQVDLPGVSGPARVERRSDDLLRRARPGDVLIIDHADLDRRTAEALVAADVVAVVNAAPSISGRYPNLGPEVLLAAGVVLVDGVGTGVLHRLKDGTRVRVHEGAVFAGDREIARGTEQTPDSVADLLIEAKAGMSTQLEAFSANTIEFLRRERTLILDGVGVPEVDVSVVGRHVVVVAPGYGHADDLKRLRRYLREYRPVLVGVEGGAETLRAAGFRPDLIVGDPGAISAEALRCGAEVVVPAHLDGHAPGLERIQDLGVGAVTFPASGNPEDLALLLADAHGAELVVTVGFQATLHEFLDRGRLGSNPSTFLTRLRLGSKVLDGAAVVALQRARISTASVLALVLAVLLVAVLALVVTGVADGMLLVLGDAGGSTWTYLRGLFG